MDDLNGGVRAWQDLESLWARRFRSHRPDQGGAADSEGGERRKRNLPAGPIRIFSNPSKLSSMATSSSSPLHQTYATLSREAASNGPMASQPQR